MMRFLVAEATRPVLNGPAGPPGKGTVDGKPDACEPCKHPQEVANNCAACADDVMKQSKTILCRDAPRGGICRNSNLAALLVHEAAHNCVGGHDTTNPDKQPKQQPTATCDKCGRPDAGGIEGGFKPMR